MADDPLLSGGAVAERTGDAVSAIRFYEDKELIESVRAEAGHRRFGGSVIRRLAFVMTSQKLGYTLDEIKRQLDRLPNGRTPTEGDWSRMATQFDDDIDARIAGLERLRDTLGGCIGCGCLSLQRCAMWNPDDGAAALGEGPRYLLGDTAAEVVGLSDPSTPGRASR